MVVFVEIAVLPLVENERLRARVDAERHNLADEDDVIPSLVADDQAAVQVARRALDDWRPSALRAMRDVGECILTTWPLPGSEMP